MYQNLLRKCSCYRFPASLFWKIWGGTPVPPLLSKIGYSNIGGQLHLYTDLLKWFPNLARSYSYLYFIGGFQSDCWFWIGTQKEEPVSLQAFQPTSALPQKQPLFLLGSSQGTVCIEGMHAYRFWFLFSKSQVQYTAHIVLCFLFT